MRIKKGRWEFSDVFLEVSVAHDWGMRPSEFWDSSESDRAFMIAYSIDSARMRAWEEALTDSRLNKGMDQLEGLKK